MRDMGDFAKHSTSCFELRDALLPDKSDHAAFALAVGEVSVPVTRLMFLLCATMPFERASRIVNAALAVTLKMSDLSASDVIEEKRNRA